MKRLYKSQTNKVLSGLLGGLGDYWNVDPVMLRVVYVFIACVTGVIPGIIAYLIGSLIVPLPPSANAGSASNANNASHTQHATPKQEPSTSEPLSTDDKTSA
jgi:phage shock protein C